MAPLSRIVFATDFSEGADAMVPCVQEWASRFGSEVIVLHAFHLVRDYILGPGLKDEYVGRAEIPYTADLQALRNHRKVLLEEFARQHFAAIRHRTRIEDGDAAVVIDWVVKQEQADLVIMPSKGWGKFRRWLLGSITSKVLHDVMCPVLTSAHAVEAGPAAGCGYKSLVCGIELGRETDRVLKMAGLLAQTYGARLSVVHVQSHAGEEEVTAEKLRAVLRRDLAESAVAIDDVKVQVLDVPVEEGIRAAAIEEKADLVVLGRGHEHETFGRIRSHLYDIIRESPCPVLSV